jgi:acyl carrier protein
LYDFLKAKLPHYMMPSTFVLLESLPLTNGKIDRQALPTPDTNRPDLAEAFVAPRTQVEQALADIWAKVLNLNQIGVHDNFLDLGGDSLLATQIVSHVRQDLDVDLLLPTLFEKPTVAELASAILQSKMKEIGSENVAAILANLDALTDAEAKLSLDKS